MARISGTYDPQKVEITIGRPTSADGSDLPAIEPVTLQGYSASFTYTFHARLPTVTHDDHGAPHVHDVGGCGKLWGTPASAECEVPTAAEEEK